MTELSACEKRGLVLIDERQAMLNLATACYNVDIYGHEAGLGRRTYILPSYDVWQVHFVGKILGPSAESKMSARGACKDKVIPSDAQVKDFLVLGRPGPAMAALDHVYCEQIETLRDLLTQEETRTRKRIAETCIMPRSSGGDDHLHVYLPAKYEDNPLGLAVGDSFTEAQVSNFYRANLLPDYHKHDFESRSRVLVQSRIFDDRLALVRPWEQYKTYALVDCGPEDMDIRRGSGKGARLRAHGGERGMSKRQPLEYMR